MSKAELERVIAALRRAHAASPYERIGQFIANSIPRTHAMPDLFYIEDHRLAEALEETADERESKND